MRRWGINGRLQRELFLVRGKLTLRQFIREPGKLLGLIIAVLIFLPFVLGFAVLTTLGYLRLDPPWNAQLLGGVLTLLWLGWILYPIIFSSLNEGLDVQRLLLYPVSGRDVAFSVIIGTLADYMTYIVLPLFLAVLIGWWGNWLALPLIVLAILLAYGHMILASQLVLTIFGGIFQSRRFRDIAVIIGSLFGVSCYLLQYAGNALAEFGDDLISAEQLATFRPLNGLQWLPPGAAARAIEQAFLSQWGNAFLWLGYTAVWLVAIGWLWWRLLGRLSSGHGFVFNPRPKVVVEQETAVLPTTQHSLRWLPDDIYQLIVKELKALWRTPQRRVGLFWSALLPLFFIGPFLASNGLPQTIPSWMGIAFPAYAVFSVWSATQNMLGLEGKGLPLLLLLPVPRHRIFLAKTVALLLPTLPILLLLIVGLFWLVGGWTVVAGVVVALAGSAIAVGGTAVGSVLFPYPVNLEKSSGNTMLGNGGGCRSALGNAIVIPLLIFITNAPLWAALAVAYWQHWVWLGYLAAAISLPYGLWLYWLAIRQAGRLMQAREADILQALLSV